MIPVRRFPPVVRWYGMEGLRGKKPVLEDSFLDEQVMMMHIYTHIYMQHPCNMSAECGEEVLGFITSSRDLCEERGYVRMQPV